MSDRLDEHVVLDLAPPFLGGLMEGDLLTIKIGDAEPVPYRVATVRSAGHGGATIDVDPVR